MTILKKNYFLKGKNEIKYYFGYSFLKNYEKHERGVIYIYI